MREKIEKIKKVKDYMSQKVVTISPEASIFEAAEILAKHHISGAPVIKNDKLIGVISESDIVNFMRLKLPTSGIKEEPHLSWLIIANLIKNHLQFKKELKRISEFKVKNVMSKDPITIGPEETILEAATKMAKHDVQRLLVVERGKLVGIITRADLLRALLE